MNQKHRLGLGCALAFSGLLLSGCSDSDDDKKTSQEGDQAQLSEAVSASRAVSCESLASDFSFANTSITGAETVAAGTETVAGQAIAEHCLISGNMFARTSDVDGRDYAVGFEMRLPTDWNGRYFYQANGGIDGSVVPALGSLPGGGALTNALHEGFAVISSDAGHSGGGPLFGYDPQARLDYGYQAVGKLTPMAKALIAATYGKAPDRSYIGGCSNGGRHTMVAANRYADDYDGYLIGAPGYNLPQAALANIAGAQLYASVSGADTTDLASAITATERGVLVNAILAQCDALDGLSDGLIEDRAACQASFDIQTHVPTCTAERDGSCLSDEQKSVLSQIHAGVQTGQGEAVYASFPWDAGLADEGVMSWEYAAPVSRDSGALGMIFKTPPVDLATFDGLDFVFNSDIDVLFDEIYASNELFTESGMTFMTPPNPTDMSDVKSRGAKILAYHGTSDAIFSLDDTIAWYDGLTANHGGDASDFARLYPVAGMGHCRGGPAVDQFDLLSELVAWVEKGEEPGLVVASVRGSDNVGGANASLPTDWSATRTRPLCEYPLVARYDGSGDPESAESFSCQP